MRRDMPYDGYLGVWGHLAGLILFLLVLTGIGLLVALLVRQARSGRPLVRPAAGTPAHGQPPMPGTPGGPPPGVPMDALRILDERLARGDIEVADYAARRRALTGEPDAPRPFASPDETRVDPSV